MQNNPQGKPMQNQGKLKPGLETGPGKKLYPLQWIYRLNIKNFHFFPLVIIVLLLIGVIPMILIAFGLPLPHQSQAPVVRDVLSKIGIFNDRDLFVTATWILWWPLFIGTIFIFRRIWCGGFCPFGLVTDMGNFVRRKLRKNEPAKPVSVTRFVFMGFLTFLTLGYLHDALNITNSIVMSVEFVLFFFLFAFIVGVMLPRRSFCRSFCFVGALPHLFGRLAVLGLQTDRNKCVKCEGQWCQTGSKNPPVGIATFRGPLINVDGCPMYINVPQLGHTESNRHCILCGNCIKNCPYDAIEYKYLTPGYEILKGIQLNWHETFFTLGIISVLAMFAGLEGGLMMQWGEWLINVFHLPSTKFHWAIAGSYVLVAAVAIFALYFVASMLSALILKINTKKAIHLPFAYLMFFRDIFVVYFVDASVVQVLLGKGPQWFMLIVPSIEFFLMVIATAWSMFLGWRLVQLLWSQENEGKEMQWQDTLFGVAPHFLMISGLTWYWLDLLSPEKLEQFATLGISPWVPFAVPVVLVLAFMVGLKLFKKEQVAVHG